MTSEGAADTVDQDVFGGVDSHTDTVHVAVISDNGGHLADAEFATTAAGYVAALAFLTAHGRVIAIGVEGTSSYGAGFTRTARSHGHPVIEVNRPDKAERRRTGKSDPIDAYAAARAALSGRATSSPRTTRSVGYAPCTTPPARPSRPAPPHSTRSARSSSPLRRRSARSTGSSRAPTAPRPWPGYDRPATPSTSLS